MKKDDTLSHLAHMMPKSTAEADFFKAAILAAIPAAMAQGYKERHLDLEADGEGDPWRALDTTICDAACYDTEAKAALVMAMAVLENYRALNSNQES